MPNHCHSPHLENNYQIILMENESHRRTGWYRKSYLIVSWSPWESQGTGWWLGKSVRSTYNSGLQAGRSRGEKGRRYRQAAGLRSSSPTTPVCCPEGRVRSRAGVETREVAKNESQGPGPANTRLNLGAGKTDGQANVRLWNSVWSKMQVKFPKCDWALMKSNRLGNCRVST